MTNQLNFPIRPLEDLRLPTEGESSLLAWKGRTELGDDREESTALAKNVGSRRKMLEDVLSFATEGVDARIVDLEMSEAKKVGPIQPQLPWSDRRDSVAPYWKADTDSPDERLLDEATLTVLNSMGRFSLRPTSYEDSAERMPRGTNLGLPWMTRDRGRVQDYLDRAKSLNSVGELFPAIAFVRKTPDGEDGPPKQRLVWGFDHAETIAAGRFQQPFLNTVRDQTAFAAWKGPDAVDVAVYSIWSQFEGRAGARMLSVDYSSFDTNASERLIRKAFWILRQLFPSARRELDILEEIFLTVGLVTPDGWIVGRRRGVPSGSTLTNLIDSLINMIATVYALLQWNKSGSFIVQGDDALIAGTLELGELASSTKELGMVLNDEKTLESDTTAHVLQKLYLIDKRSKGIASIARRVTKLSGYENLKPNWNDDLETMRYIMQVEACRFHPKFVEFVQYVLANDRVLASSDPVNIAKRAGGVRGIEDKLGLEGFPGNDREVSGLGSFDTVRVVRELKSSRARISPSA